LSIYLLSILDKVTVYANHLPGFPSQEDATGVAIHKMYQKTSPAGNINDIAVIRLQRPFRYASFLRPAVLAGLKSPDLTLNDACIVAGFGKSRNAPRSSGQ